MRRNTHMHPFQYCENYQIQRLNPLTLHSVIKMNAGMKISGVMVIRPPSVVPQMPSE